MFYYQTALLGSSLEPLTYRSLKQVKNGYVIKVPLKTKESFGVVVQAVEEPSFECQDIIETTKRFFTASQLERAKFISEYYSSSLGLALGLFVPYESEKTAFAKLEIPPPALTAEQRQAFEFAKSHKMSLIFGDTGSGKSEIYIALICDALSQGKNALFLLPEIGLTPQLEARLKVFFGDLVVLWHSKLTKKRKTEILSAINEGRARVILGARSALFLPLYDTELIIVDEEHDESYKSNSAPRYNARDISLMTGAKENIKVVLGSATPSLATALKIPYFRLKGTFFKSDKEIIFENAHNELTDKLLHEIKKTLAKKQQIIVFLPTRAHFKYITCKACGKNIECPYCSVSMSLHKNINALKCHYCGFTARIFKICPECKSETMEATRLGTAEVVDRLREIFSGYRIEKFDKDEITTDIKLNRTLKSFQAREIDILVGTQMLSKGHDYHGVGLSIVMGIDSLLAMNDFKAREKALSLAIQIAGRSGRKEKGVVFIQSKNCDFFEKYIEDYDSFLEYEKHIRDGLYPPSRKLMRLLISHKNEMKAKEITDKTVHILENCESVEIVGAGDCDISKIALKYRYFILLRSKNIKPLLRAAKLVRDRFIQIDMDPLNFS
ncbi:MAG: primosomal protein N' [Campylobacteraceae bacterium]|jgi:primosomal protein N' (replication factor Y)|nr:primosomal protein N' [Campylobacteraceae bacterium]